MVSEYYRTDQPDNALSVPWQTRSFRSVAQFFLFNVRCFFVFVALLKDCLARHGNSAENPVLKRHFLGFI